MLTDTLKKALNRQLNAEIYSAYLYFGMSAYFESISLKGFANWMRVQAQEEMTHALKFYAYINGRGGNVILSAIEEPPQNWSSPLNIFENVLAHEQKVTGMINELVNLAIQEKDHATGNMLQWFVSEQVEEEASADEIIQKLKLIGDAKSGLFMLDQQLGQRVFTPLATPAEQ